MGFCGLLLKGKTQAERLNYEDFYFLHVFSNPTSILLPMRRAAIA
jgi:hypothetical protein